MVTKLFTVGDLVRLTGQPIHRVEYILSSRNIEPAQRAGRFRLYEPNILDRIQQEIENMAPRRNQRRGA